MPAGSESTRPRSRRAVARAIEALDRRVLLASIAGTVFNDYDGDFVRSGVEPGLAGSTVYLDLNNNGQFDGTNKQFTSTTPVNIPPTAPDATAGTSTSTIHVTGVGTAQQVRVEIHRLTHTYVGDLRITLISPAGTRVTLANLLGGSGDDYVGTVFDDDAPASIASVGAPFTGVLRPQQPLSAFTGQNANGNWTLEIVDTEIGDFGRLESWSIHFSSGEKSRITDASGAYLIPAVDPGIYSVRQVLQPGFTATGPLGGAAIVALADSESVATDIHFGARQPAGTVSGVIFGDYNANGARDAGEPGLAGWTVYADLDNNARLSDGEPTAVTNSAGQYTLNVPPGEHRIRQELRPGFFQTSPATGGVLQRQNQPAPQAPAGPEHSRSEVIVRVNDRRGLRELDRYLIDQPSSALAGLIDLSGSSQLFRVERSSVVAVSLRDGIDPHKAIALLGRLSIVEYAELNRVSSAVGPELTPNDPLFAQQYHHMLMQSPSAWDTTVGNAKVLVGVVDNGLAMSHPDLWMNVWVNPGEIPLTRRNNLTDINGDGYISMLELNDPINIGTFKINDVNGDGRIDWLDLTAVSGGGGIDNGTGGWANGIDEGGNGFVDDLVGRDVWDNDSNPSPNGTEDHGTLVAGVIAARINNALGVAGIAGGATILPIRFFGTNRLQTSLDFLRAYTYAAAAGVKVLNTSYNIEPFQGQQSYLDALNVMYNAGILHFNSAGNTNTLNPGRQTYDHTLYVANTQQTDLRQGSSNRGWGIDLAAPGTNIISTGLGSSANIFTYEPATGTSFAAPMAAGVAALLWSIHPEWSREQVAAAIIQSAVNIDAIQTSSDAGLIGAGRVSAGHAVNGQFAPPKFKNTINTPLLAGLPDEGETTDSVLRQFTLDTAGLFDSATMIASSFDLRGAGLDGVFDTADDIAIPFSLGFGDESAMSTVYRVGTNRLVFNITGAMAAGEYRFTASATLTDPFGTPLDGNGDGIAGDALVRRFTINGVTNPVLVNVASGSATGGIDFGFHKTEGMIASMQFLFDEAQALALQFDENIGSTLSGDDVIIHNLTTGVTTSAFAAVMTFDPASNTALLTFQGPALADGNYIATLPASSISDGYGNGLRDDLTLHFFVLAGDANRDRVVNLMDFNILAANFGRPGATFAQGNFDYSGSVDLDDFTLLAAQFTQAVPPARTAFAVGFSGVEVSTGIPPLFATTPIAGDSRDRLPSIVDDLAI